MWWDSSATISENIVIGSSPFDSALLQHWCATSTTPTSGGEKIDTPPQPTSMLPQSYNTGECNMTLVWQFLSPWEFWIFQTFWSDLRQCGNTWRCLVLPTRQPTTLGDLANVYMSPMVVTRSPLGVKALLKDEPMYTTAYSECPPPLRDLMKQNSNFPLWWQNVIFPFLVESR
jgi:hypothetical protein